MNQALSTIVVAKWRSSPAFPPLVGDQPCSHGGGNMRDPGNEVGWWHSPTVVHLLPHESRSFLSVIRRQNFLFTVKRFFLQVVTKRPPPSHVEVENYGFKMFIFIMFILALIMIPIAIVWETRKTYIKSTDAYKGLAKWVFRSFGYKI